MTSRKAAVSRQSSVLIKNLKRKLRTWLGLIPTGIVLAAGTLALLAHWGCHGPASNPTSPGVTPLRGFTLNFSVPLTNEIKASLLNVSSNEVLYNVTGPNMSPVTGVAGPFGTSSSVGAGELDFPIAVPQGSARLIAFELTNAANGQPLALGAVQTDISAGGVSDIWVTMGSVIRNCYAVDTSAFFPPGPDSGAVSNVYFTFNSDTLSTTPTGDMAVTTVPGGFSFVAQSPNQIAYMGNGPLVNFTSAPGTFTGSGPTQLLKTGDVYCVSLGAGAANGYAWVQVTNANEIFNINNITSVYSAGPKFLYRINHSLPYFAYDETSADQNSTCSTPVPTYTYIPTNTFTPTPSPTVTNTPTITATPTDTATATITDTPSSPTATFTYTVSDTPTNTSSPTNSPAVGSPTATFTPSPTVTSTFTFTPSPTFVAGYFVTSSATPLITDPNNGAWESFVLTINATSNGNPAVSYALVTDSANSEYAWVGPWTYTGSGTNFSVTLTGGDFNLSNPVSTSFSVALYNAAQNQLLASCVPTGVPATLEAPEEYFYYDYEYENGYYNVMGCAATAEDGNCQGVSFYSYLEVHGSNPVTSLIELIDTSSSVTAFLGPVTASSYFNGNWYLSPAQFGVTEVGQQALAQTIVAQLVDANTDAVLDEKSLGTFSLESSSSAYIASSGISILQTDPNNGACQRFVLTINADAPTGVLETSYAAVTDMANGQYAWVGPWTYTGNGNSFTVTMTGGDWDITTPTLSSLKVLLYADNQTQFLDSNTPAGSPLTLESPEEYFYSDDSYYEYNALGCAVTAEDGNCQGVSFYSYLTTPNDVPVTSLIELIDTSNSVTAFLGPVTGTGSGDTWYLSPAQFGVTVVGQQALGQTILAQLVDANTQAVLDEKPLGSLNLEYPSSAYIASSAISVLQTDPNNGDCQRFVLTIDADAPTGVSETSYAAVTNTASGQYVWVGPWTYTGNGNSFTVTMSGGDLDITSPTDVSLKVLLYSDNQTQLLDSNTPAGSPLTLEAPEEYFYNDDEYENGYYNVMGCAATAEDGNCQGVSFYSYVLTPNDVPVTSLIELIDTSNSVTAFLGPVTGTGQENTWYLSSAQFGVTEVGQQALGQTILAQLVDANTQAVLDEKPMGSLNLEYPSRAYIASSSLSCLQSNANGCQSFVVTITANAPTSVTETNYAILTDMANNELVTVGPWNSVGGTGTTSVTLSAGAFEATSPAYTSFRVALLNSANAIQDVATPTGSPLTLATAQEYMYSSSLSCLTQSEDGNCVTFVYNAYLEDPSASPVTGYIKLVDETNGNSITLGPVTNTGTYTNYPATLTGANFGLAANQGAVSQVFQAQLYDSTQTQLWDIRGAGTLSIENSGGASIILAGASVSAGVTDASGNWESFVLTIDANTSGGPAESYAKVADTTNGYFVWVGPWSYTGSGTSFSVTLTGGDFNLSSSPVSASLAVTLYDPTQTQAYGNIVPTGSPVSLEAPKEYFYSDDGYYGYNDLGCATTAEDGNCQGVSFYSYLQTSSGSGPVTSLIQLINLSSSVTAFLGPVTTSSYAYGTWYLTPAQFGVTEVGQQAMGQTIMAQLVDANTDAVLDEKSVGSLNLESPSSAYISSSSVSAAVTNATGCEQFVLTIDADAPPGVSETSYAAVTDMANGYYAWVGPWTYTGSGSSFSVTLVGGDLGITNPTVSSLKVLLYADNQTQILDNNTPAGSPLTLESPEEYFYYDDGYDNGYYNNLSCATTATDGNCKSVSFYSYLETPNDVPVTSLIELINLSNSVTAFLGPVTGTGGSDVWYLSPAQFGVTEVGQQALGQTILAQLVDANTQAVLDEKPQGTLNLEYPSSAYIASSSVSAAVTTATGCEQFVLTVDANAPAGVEQTSYAAVTDTASGYYAWVGPWTYTGSGSSFSVTLTGGDLGITTPTAASLKVLLYGDSQGGTVLDSATPAGSPLTLEVPKEYFYYDDGYYGYNDLGCAATAENGNCQSVSFYSYLQTSGSGPVTSLIELIDTSSGVTAFLGPVTTSSYAYETWYLSPAQFGVTIVGEQAPAQTILAQLVDANTQAVLDQKPLGSLNLEYPSQAYIASSAVSVLQTDPNNQACQQFELTINANSPAGVNETSYAVLANMANSQLVTLGPWNYEGNGGSFSATLTGGDLGLTSAVTTSLKVMLYNKTMSQILDSSTPAGSPLALEPTAVSFYSGYPFIECQTTGEDGNCETFELYTYLYNSQSAPETVYVEVTNASNSVSQIMGPVTLTGQGYVSAQYPLSASEFGVNAGQAASNQVFQAKILNLSQTVIYDTKQAGILNLESP